MLTQAGCLGTRLDRLETEDPVFGRRPLMAYMPAREALKDARDNPTDRNRGLPEGSPEGTQEPNNELAHIRELDSGVGEDSHRKLGLHS